MSLLEQPRPTSRALLARLAALRWKARQLMVLHGLGLVATTIFGGEMILAVLDYCFVFPPIVRVLLLLAGCVGLIFLVRNALVRPLRLPISDAFLARQIESVAPELHDELISAVDFIGRDHGGQNVLAQQVLEEAESRALELPIEQALNRNIWIKPCGGAVLLLAIIITTCFLLPQHAAVAAARWMNPFSDIPWPRKTFVSLEWPEKKPAPKAWPIGEPLTIRARVARGYENGMHVWLESATDRQPQARELMTEQNATEQGVYERVLEPQGTELRVRVTAGDDRDQPMTTLRLVARPTVSGLLAHIAPPAYAKAERTTVDLLTQSPRVIEGSQVTLEIHTSKPLTTKSTAAWLIQPEDQSPLALPVQAKRVDDSTTQLTFTAARPRGRGEPLRFRVQVRDEDGFENRVMPTVALDVIADSQPSVFITEPRRQLEVVPEAVFDVGISASDDLGLTDLLLVAEDFNAAAGKPPRMSRALNWSQTQRDPATGVFTSKATYTWDLTSLGLKPGERLTFFASVRDNYSVPANADTPNPLTDPFERVGDGVRHKFVQSGTMTISIVTRERAEETVRRAMQEIRDQLRNLQQQQELTAQQTAALRDVIQQTGTITPAQAQQLAELAAKQAGHALRAATLEQNAAQISQNITMNRMQETELAKIAKNLRQGLQDIAGTSMPRAAQELHRAGESAAKPQDAQQAANQASKEQQQALSDMQKLIDQLGAAGDFEALRAKTAEILKKQQDLEKDLRELAMKTVGKDASQLTPEQKKVAEKIAGDQQKLAAASADLTEKLDKAAEQLKAQDPGSSASMKEAAQASRQNNVPGNQSSAAGGVNRNQTSSAAADMARARRGLEEMMRQLDQQSRRQLEELSRKLAELLEQVQQLRAKQAALNDKTNEAGARADRKTLSPLGDQQGRLQGNALAIAKTADATKGGKPAGDDIRDASDQMGKAAVGLVKGIFADAPGPQKEALAALDRAIEKLQKLKNDLDKKLQQEDLAAIRKQYEAIKAAQEQIRERTRQIESRRAKGDLPRADLIKLAEQGTAQNKLIGQVMELSKKDDLKDIEVLALIHKQLVGAMRASGTGLLRGESGKPVVSQQDTAIRKLAAIIDALKEDQPKPSEFAGDSGGGQGGGQGGKQPLVPPVAQLKMLKALQTDINDQTQTLHDQMKDSSDQQKPAVKQQITELGTQQDQIKSMAQKIMENLK